MKKIAVIGLGIIGGSISGALTTVGYVVDGFDKDEEVIARAIEFGFIRKKAENLTEYDVVFIAVPPKATIEYLTQNRFKDNALVTDICGIKEAIETAVYAKPRNYRYVGMHPMAGKETSGISSASPTLFLHANVIITLAPQTQEDAIAELKEYIKAMRFGNIVECSAKTHDKKIAVTSQLAHIVSNAYVKSGEVKGCDGFTGGSFQDMTRIAGVDEAVWTPLYAYNRENIITELDGLIKNLAVYRDALVNKDDQKLSETLKEGRKIRETIRRPND